MMLFIDPANDAPRGQNGPIQGTLAPIYLQWETETMSLELLHFVCSNCSTILVFNPSTCSPGVHTDHTPGQGSLAPLQVKLSRSGERLQLQDPWSSGSYF